MIIDDLRAEMDSIDTLVDWASPADPETAAKLALPTVAKGWTVGDTLGHLAWTDLAGVVALSDAEDFAAKARALAVPTVEQLPDVWPAARAQLLAGLAEAQAAGKRLPWFSLPMGAASFATARLMEYWAHGSDAALALGITRAPAARLRNVCHIGVLTMGFSFVQHGLDAPTEPVRVELAAPDGSTWEWGDAGAANRVTGPALDFAFVVTQRRLAADSALVAQGPVAAAWLPIAQCFAGNGQYTDPDRAGLPMS
ncbi:MAG: wyosine base formation protein [Pseudonocardiales bacterium]|nr:wyosine base formation protein [Jatrophihabitantaceae bacterium]MCW2605241.1 wyosine base formation protein [Pseudonocardiales bacterium]